MYWPRMSADLTDAVQGCSTCQEMQPAQQKEPMMSYPLPKLPWQVIASKLEGQHNAVIVDLYSDYVEVFKMPNLSTQSLIEGMKPIFATHGTPAVLITDNGSNYTSKEFRTFTTAWDINHVMSSHHHKSNGKAESAVKIIKNIMWKAQKDKKDVRIAILEWRNAPTPGSTSSPTQRLMSHRTRSLLPCNNKMLKPKVQPHITEQLKYKRQIVKHYHNRNTKILPKLHIAQPVRVNTHPQQPHDEWREGNVVSEETALCRYTVDR